MIPRAVTLPELAMIGGTRAALGAGVGLLLADRLAPEQRRAVGWTLLAVGVITTIPLLAQVVFRKEARVLPARQPSARPRAATGLVESEPDVHRLEDELDHAGLEEPALAENEQRPAVPLAETANIEHRRVEKWGGPQP